MSTMMESTYRLPHVSTHGAPGASPSHLDLPQSPHSPTLKTSKLINIPPLLPATLKLTNDFISHSVCPATGKSPINTTGAWEPGAVVPLPPSLRFDSWWFEGGQRCTMHVNYDTETKLCTASMRVAVHGAVSAQGTVAHTQRPVEPWDLHVGARLNLLGKQVTLRKASDTATLSWLDSQAAALLRDKAALQRELEKYRPVASRSVQYSNPQRSELMEPTTHEQLPSGGRTNLRNLRHHVEQLVSALRSHQNSFPRIRSAVAADLLANTEGPTNWSIQQPADPATTAMQRSSSSGDGTSSAKASRTPRSPTNRTPREPQGVRLDPISMDSILAVPLAASAAGLTGKGAVGVKGPTSPDNKLLKYSKSRPRMDPAEQEKLRLGLRTRPSSPKSKQALASPSQPQPLNLETALAAAAAAPPAAEPSSGSSQAAGAVAALSASQSGTSAAVGVLLPAEQAAAGAGNVGIPAFAPGLDGQQASVLGEAAVGGEGGEAKASGELGAEGAGSGGSHAPEEQEGADVRPEAGGSREGSQRGEGSEGGVSREGSEAAGSEAGGEQEDGAAQDLGSEKSAGSAVSAANDVPMGEGQEGEEAGEAGEQQEAEAGEGAADGGEGGEVGEDGEGGEDGEDGKGGEDGEGADLAGDEAAAADEGEEAGLEDAESPAADEGTEPLAAELSAGAPDGDEARADEAESDAAGEQEDAAEGEEDNDDEFWEEKEEGEEEKEEAGDGDAAGPTGEGEAEAEAEGEPEEGAEGEAEAEAEPEAEGEDGAGQEDSDPDAGGEEAATQQQDAAAEGQDKQFSDEF